MKVKKAKAVNRRKRKPLKKRFLGEITVFEIILCIFVILIHLCSEPLNNYDRQSLGGIIFFFINKIVSFAVSGFIFSSGLKLFYNSDSKPVKYCKFITRRITKIYLPYIFWVCAYYLFFVYYMKYFDFSFEELLGYIAEGNLVAHFYFIIIIMQFYLLFPLIKLFINKVPPFFGIVISVFVTVVSKAYLMDFAYNDRIFITYLIFFILGCYVGKNYDAALRLLKQVKYGIYLLAGVFAFAYLSFSFSEYQGVGYYDITEVLKIFFCIFMFLSMFLILAKSEAVERLSESSFIKICGASTFYIYLIHCMFIFTAEKELSNLGVSGTLIRFFIKFVFVYLTSFSLSYLYVRLKKLLIKPNK